MQNRIFSDYDLPYDHEEAAFGILRRFWWCPSIHDEAGELRLYLGDQFAARFDTHAELRAFVSGMATVCLTLPPEIIREMERLIGADDDPDPDDRPDWWSQHDLP